VLAALARARSVSLDSALHRADGRGRSCLRYAGRPTNRLTIPMSGTGSAAMEATLANTVEPGDSCSVCRQGLLRSAPGGNMASAPGRGSHHRAALGGRPSPLAEIEAARCGHQPKILAMLHAENLHGASASRWRASASSPSPQLPLLAARPPSPRSAPCCRCISMPGASTWPTAAARKACSCPRLGPFSMGPARASGRRRQGKVAQ